VPFEVVIVLNASPHDVADLVREEVRGATVVESRVNRGVAGGYNLGRTAARGEFIVVLHDDVEVSHGWLDALVAAADSSLEAGAVGSRAVNPDGSLQAAGAVLHADGTTEALKVDSPVLRAVDYSGSYCLLVRAATWDAVGGFDERFFPAYHVDVDFATAIRAHGQLVLYEPRAQVVHHRWGMRSDESFRVFAAQQNLRRYIAKWHLGRLDEERPTSDEDYRRLDSELKDAYIAELERRLHAAQKEVAGIQGTSPWRPRMLLGRLLRRRGAPSRTE